MHSFAADDMVTIVLATKPQDDDVHLTLQSFDIGGQLMLPLFTSAEKFQASLKGRDFPYPVVEIRFGTLVEMLKGDETILVNPGTPEQYAFSMNDLEPRA